MRLASSTHYYFLLRRAPKEVALHQRIAELARSLRARLRRVAHQLRIEGLHIDHKVLARIMLEQWLHVRPCAGSCAPSDHQKPDLFPTLQRLRSDRSPNRCT